MPILASQASVHFFPGELLIRASVKFRFAKPKVLAPWKKGPMLTTLSLSCLYCDEERDRKSCCLHGACMPYLVWEFWVWEEVFWDGKNFLLIAGTFPDLYITLYVLCTFVCLHFFLSFLHPPFPLSPFFVCLPSRPSFPSSISLLWNLNLPSLPVLPHHVSPTPCLLPSSIPSCSFSLTPLSVSHSFSPSASPRLSLLGHSTTSTPTSLTRGCSVTLRQVLTCWWTLRRCSFPRCVCVCVVMDVELIKHCSCSLFLFIWL